MNDLRVAIVHYHLRGGGVTRIIEHTVAALQDHPVNYCIISGEEFTGNYSIPKEDVVVVEGLSYGSKTPERAPEEILEEMKLKTKKKLGGEPDVWHFHNHSLGKNSVFPIMVLYLAKSKARLLLHIHDFAEDNRPDNYDFLAHTLFKDEPLTTQLYPLAPHVHYAVLNGRDYKLLQDIAVPQPSLHLLSNPVDIDLPEQQKSKGKKQTGNKIPGEKLILYPFRVIPRKNIGELILWSALAEAGEHFAVTLPPQNPKYKKVYQSWKKMVEELNLPVTFEAGSKWDISYPELISQSDAFLTTSIAEGFGLVYLESWLSGKPLLGRILPNITDDFKDKKIQFPGMYEQLKIPVVWIGRENLVERFEKNIQTHWQRFGLTPEQSKLENWLDNLLIDSYVDFGKLDEELQKQVIKKLADNPGLRKEIKPNALFTELPHKKVIQKNQAIIEKEYNLNSYGERLLSLYTKINKSPYNKPIYGDAYSLLNRFLSPEYFSLLRM